jgi:predicted GIY-YIG superfamily endonuclease
MDHDEETTALKIKRKIKKIKKKKKISGFLNDRNERCSKTGY